MNRTISSPCCDWRDCPAEIATTLVSTEVRAWREQLDWDVRDAWAVIEPARRARRLPGFVVFDHDQQPVGWTSFLLHRNCLQVMALVARTAAETVALVDAVLTSAEAASSTRALVCVREAAPALGALLAERGFRVETYHYLVLDRLPEGSFDAGVLRPWHHEAGALVRLCAEAYGSSAEVRAFAPGGTDDEWREYVASLVQGPGCGQFEPELSRVAPGRSPGEIEGAVVVTTIAPGVAHIAQMAVAPGSRGRGVGTSLVCASLAAAYRRGYATATLLVAAKNTAAVRLYRALGFRDRATFVVAMRGES